MTDPAHAGRSRGARALGVTALSISFAVGSASRTTARADVVLHEYIPADPADDLRLGATTEDGAIAAAIETQTGPVQLPDGDASGKEAGTVYNRELENGNRTFHVDRDTTKPGSVGYSDPFTPAIAPYKREFAYDSVDEHGDLIVRDTSLVRVPAGAAPRAEDDQFYADLPLDLTEGQPIRIPTVGPGTRWISWRATPETDVSFFRDSADNWFVKGGRDGRIRLVLHLAIDRAVFGSPFPDSDWARLARFAPQIPEHVKATGVAIAREIGVVDGTGPAEALRALVKHFREFKPSTDRPKSSGLDLYKELSTSQKGVCRHRSYAFVVTALALGLPARFVRNEAHAWVEVFDAVRWHRIDLGGAADELDFSDENRVAHVPPRDPFEWPRSSESGEAVAARSRASTHGGNAAASASSAAASSSGARAPAEPTKETDPDDRRPRSSLTIDFSNGEARHGSRIKISGRIDAGGSACGQVRVDLFLDAPNGGAGTSVPLGTLVTGGDGRYSGSVVVPYTAEPGDYGVHATTPGSAACGPGESG
jgi:hypothetical protein